MKVVIVAVFWAHLLQPGLTFGGAAERAFDRCIDKDALHLRVLCGGAQHRQVPRCPDSRVHIQAIGADYLDARDFLALRTRHPVRWHGFKPDIGVQAQLV